MQIDILCNDVPLHEGMRHEHGFSCLIEYAGKKLLFDVGDSGVFLENAAALNLNTSLLEVRYVCLSHAHYDHTGGLMRFAAHRSESGKKEYAVLLRQKFFVPKYWEEEGLLRYVGNRFTDASLLENDVPFYLIQNDLYKLPEIAGAFLLGGFSLRNEFEHITPEARAYSGETYNFDTFMEEQVFLADTKEGVVLITGCSHTGIVNICEKARTRLSRPLCAVIGGMHLEEVPEKQLSATIAYFNAHPEITQVMPMHCTGEASIARFAAECPAYRAAGAGSRLLFQE